MVLGTARYSYREKNEHCPRLTAYLKIYLRGAWVAQSVKRLTLDLGSSHDLRAGRGACPSPHTLKERKNNASFEQLWLFPQH